MRETRYDGQGKIEMPGPVVDRVLTVPGRIGCRVIISGRNMSFNLAMGLLTLFQPS